MLALALFCTYNYDAIGTARTIDGCCRSVLQHVDGANIFGRNIAERTFYAIDKYEWRHATCDGSYAAQHDAVFFRWVATGFGYAQACHLAFDEFGSIANLTYREIFFLYAGHGTCQVGFLSCAITNYVYFVDERHLFVERHVDAALLTYSNLLHFVSNKIERQHSIGIAHRQRIFTIGIGYCAVGSTLFENSYANYWFAIVVDHTTRNAFLLLRLLLCSWHSCILLGF